MQLRAVDKFSRCIRVLTMIETATVQHGYFFRLEMTFKAAGNLDLKPQRRRRTRNVRKYNRSPYFKGFLLFKKGIGGGALPSPIAHKNVLYHELNQSLGGRAAGFPLSPNAHFTSPLSQQSRGFARRDPVSLCFVASLGAPSP